MREDRRKSRRFPVLEQQQQATLRVGDVSIPARLVDQSATGFAVRVEEHPGVFPGEVVWLQTVAGWTEVRVVKARHDVDGTQIGLERIADLAVGPQQVARLLSDQLAQENPNKPWPLVGMILALGAVLGFLIWTAVGRHMHEELAASVLPQAVNPAADLRPTAVRAIEREAARRAAELHKSIHEYGHVMLTLPEVMEELKLTLQQRQKLEEIMQAAIQGEELLRNAAKAGGDRQLESKIQRLREVASEQAARILDAQQQRDFNSMCEAAVKRLVPLTKQDKKP
jgi:hypothetical protein